MVCTWGLRAGWSSWLPLKSLKDAFRSALWLIHKVVIKSLKSFCCFEMPKVWVKQTKLRIRSNETNPSCHTDLSASLCRIPCLQVTSQHYSSLALALTLAEMRVLIQLKSSWCRCSGFATLMMLSSDWYFSKGHRCLQFSKTFPFRSWNTWSWHLFCQEGTLNKFLIDDKGMLFLLAYGLPPLVHTDDATRAVLSCFDIVACTK